MCHGVSLFCPGTHSCTKCYSQIASTSVVSPLQRLHEHGTTAANAHRPGCLRARVGLLAIPGDSLCFTFLGGIDLYAVWKCMEFNNHGQPKHLLSKLASTCNWNCGMLWSCLGANLNHLEANNSAFKRCMTSTVPRPCQWSDPNRLLQPLGTFGQAALAQRSGEIC